MQLTKDQLKHVAKLANLPIPEDDLDPYSEQLSKILDYIEQLNSVDVSQVEPTYNVTGLSNVLRPDFPRESLTEEEALSNASNQKQGSFVTKGVFESE